MDGLLRVRASCWMQRGVDPFLGKISIQNLTVYLVLLTGLVSGAELTRVLPGLGDISGPALARGEWWNLLFYSFNLHLGAFGLLFAVYLMYVFGTALEEALGHARYTGFVLLTVIAITGGTVLLPTPVPAYYLELAISIGCAFAFPNMEIMLFFVLPLRLKWVAVLVLAYSGYQAVMASSLVGNAWPLVSFGVGLSGVVVFFVVDRLRGLSQQAVSRVKVSRLVADEGARHVCVTCGKTDLDDPRMDFRFCVDCADHEYCAAHIRNHEHVH